MICSRHLNRSPQLLSAALAATSDIVVVVDDHCVIGYASAAVERVLGRPAANWSQRPLADVVHPDDVDLIIDLIAAASVGLPSAGPIRVRAARADGDWATLEVSRSEQIAVADMSGTMVVLRDVSDLFETERDLERVRADFDFCVTHDAVTGLPNRTELERFLDELCDRDPGAAARTNLVMAKVLDVDELRDVHGGRDADSIVRALGRTVRALARPGDLVAVIGSGEFVVVTAPGTSPCELDALAQTMLALVDAPMTEHGIHADLRLAIGQTVLRPERGAATSLDRLGQAARRASATRARRPIVVGEPHGGDRRELRRLAVDVERALAADELELHYQPIRDAHSGRIAGFEGLLRWNHPEDGVIAASEFLPAVEGSALIVDIGAVVLAQGCEQLARWQLRYGARAPLLSLNVSARQLRQGDFARCVRTELSASGADPVGLCLELTETHALEREPLALAELERVRDLGASIALDDFGTGYSSLHHLQRIAADVLKIDRSFIRSVGIDAGATAIVRAAIDLGAAFGMSTIAEGVTTIEQHRLLLSMGCDRVQGFLIAPALPAELAEAMLSTEPVGAPCVGDVDPEQDVGVHHAWRKLSLIDVGYVPSEDEVAALAGVSSVDARHRLSCRGDLIPTPHR